jgi:hypothetical protein
MEKEYVFDFQELKLTFIKNGKTGYVTLSVGDVTFEGELENDDYVGIYPMWITPSHVEGCEKHVFIADEEGCTYSKGIDIPNGILEEKTCEEYAIENGFNVSVMITNDEFYTKYYFKKRKK